MATDRATDGPPLGKVTVNNDDERDFAEELYNAHILDGETDDVTWPAPDPAEREPSHRYGTADCFLCRQDNAARR